ncbi:YaaA family protein [Porphyromonas loveana]|uniref:YaaA family protein n=1 Tax=Porphyromonas loveana TaxID=1884669 RepID=UPI00359F6AB0
MLILISCTKTLSIPKRLPALPKPTVPMFSEASHKIALAAAVCDIDELSRLLKVNRKLAEENFHRWQQIFDENTPVAPAALAYTGMVFKKLAPSNFDEEAWRFAADHLLITSFHYGLLRPTDAIRPYRMEGTARLGTPVEDEVFHYWRPILTDYLIRRVEETGGELCFLASEEMKLLFDWARVEAAVRVVTPTFKVRQADGSLKQIVIYTKMARGLMTAHLIARRSAHVEDMQLFAPEGFTFRPDLSDEREYLFVME